MSVDLSIVEFIRARVEEDERVARAASGDTWATGASKGSRYSQPGDVYAVAPGRGAALIAHGNACGPDITAEQSSEHIARHDPERVLRQVAAWRAILSATLMYEAKIDGEWGCCHSTEAIAAGRCPERKPEDVKALRALADIWADHGDWRAEWAVGE